LQNALLCFITIILVASAAEISLRAYQSIRWNASFWGPFVGPNQTDKYFGWTPRSFYTSHIDTVDNAGTPYHIDYKTYRQGFREWPNSLQSKRKVWFIGDSFTQAKVVSNENAYYNVVKRYMPMDVFAFGADGYGTLQEYLVLDKYLKEIRPDIIVWQFTPNDFVDNDFALDSRSGGVEMGTRPYLVNGEVKYLQGLSPIKQILYETSEITSSRLIRFIQNRVFILTRPDRGALYGEIEEASIGHSQFARSYRTTQHIMKMVLERANRAKIVAFCVRDQAFFYEAFKDIMSEVGIDVITEVPEALNAAENRGIEIRVRDGNHWNEKGHEIAGIAIARGLERLLEQR
jgi:hypothetical protein